LCRTYARLQSAGYDAMTTTLTTSPHKPAALIFGIGAALAEAKFLPLDFKKQDGFARSLQLSRQLNLYRQNYCGCPFSHRPVSTTPHAKQAT